MCWCGARTAQQRVVTGRYAIARFNLETVGKPSHAGATLSSGRSAIREMARQIIAIDGMTSEDCTFSVGIVHGGQWSIVSPPPAPARR